MNKEFEEQQRQVWDLLIDCCDEMVKKGIGSQEAGFGGLSLFAKMVFDCAPTRDRAVELINLAVGHGEQMSDAEKDGYNGES